MTKTSIEWTDVVWNPVRGCVKISPGCKHCYAETFAERWRGIPGHPYERGFDLRLVPEKLAEPLSWRKPRRVFVNSMSDLFHEDVPDAFIDRVFGVMWSCRFLGREPVPGHVFQVITKRAERMREYLSTDRRTRWAEHAVTYGGAFDPDGLYDGIVFATEPHPRIWLGVSCEDQQRADERIPDLLATPAAVRWVSAEPLLGDVDLSRYLVSAEAASFHCVSPGISWVVVGGESGPGARPHCLSWARNIVHDCAFAGVPCFVKQLGRVPYETTDDADAHETWPVGQLVKLRHSKGGDDREWPADLRVRQWPGAGATP